MNTPLLKTRLIALALMAAFAVALFAPVTLAEAAAGKTVATYISPIGSDGHTQNVNWNGGVPK